jgi:hypothetical protein
MFRHSRSFSVRWSFSQLRTLFKDMGSPKFEFNATRSCFMPKTAAYWYCKRATKVQKKISKIKWLSICTLFKIRPDNSGKIFMKARTLSSIIPGVLHFQLLFPEQHSPTALMVPICRGIFFTVIAPFRTKIISPQSAIHSRETSFHLHHFASMSLIYSNYWEANVKNLLIFSWFSFCIINTLKG